MARARKKPVDQLAQDDADAKAEGLELSPRQERFCEEYAVDGNGAAAARRCGYSANRAKQTAHELLKRPAVQRRVKALLGELTQRAEYTREAVLRELVLIGMASLREVVTIRGGHVYLKPDAQIPPEAWPAIAELSNTEHGIRIKLHNKMAALDFLGRRLKMWEGTGASSVNLTVRLVREVGAGGNRGVRKVS